MNLYLIKRLDHVDHDEYYGFVIRTTTHQRSRKLAHEQGGGWLWGEDPFLHANTSKVTTLAMDVPGPEEVVLDSFRAG